MPPSVLPTVATPTPSAPFAGYACRYAYSAASDGRGKSVAATKLAANNPASASMLNSPALKNDYLERILTARVYGVATESPLELAPALSKRLGNRLLLKREDLQAVFSFKLRGAYNKMAALPAAKL